MIDWFESDTMNHCKKEYGSAPISRLKCSTVTVSGIHCPEEPTRITYFENGVQYLCELCYRRETSKRTQKQEPMYNLKDY